MYLTYRAVSLHFQLPTGWMSGSCSGIEAAQKKNKQMRVCVCSPTLQTHMNRPTFLCGARALGVFWLLVAGVRPRGGGVVPSVPLLASCCSSRRHGGES